MTGPTDDATEIRVAITADVPSIAKILAAKRAEYERYSPVFWRRADDARAAHEPFLRFLVEQDGPVVLVADSEDHAGGGDAGVEGVVTGLARAEDWVVDDFAVRDPGHWDDLGARLLAAVRRAIPDQPVTVVCGARDVPKRTMLRSVGGRLVERWWVRPLAAVDAGPDGVDPRGATGAIVPAPPVYDPGGPVCSVADWDGTAAALASVEAWARRRGAVLAVVPLPADDARETVLRDAGYDDPSEWYRFDPA
jgi:hypothetical protein